MRIDLNADVGEGADDLPIFPLVSSISVACGAHAGDEETMRRCVAEAKQRGVAVGAHPGYPDREGFGRRALDIPGEELIASLRGQIDALANVAEAAGTTLTHVKPHGALYNSAAIDERLATTVLHAIAPTGLRVFGLAGSHLIALARAGGFPVAAEAFADRRYLSDGTLAPRSRDDALIEDPAAAAAQAVAIARGEPIEPVDGPPIVLRADTICLHADTPGAIEIAEAVRKGLNGAGVEVAPLSRG